MERRAEEAYAKSRFHNWPDIPLGTLHYSMRHLLRGKLNACHVLIKLENKASISVKL